MTSLRIRDETTGVSWRVWPAPETVPPGAIREAASYLFELSDAASPDTADLLIDDIALEALRAPGPGAARWRWSPGFHAGLVEAELRQRGEPPRRFEVVTDPDLRKLTRADFDVMVREILEDTFALLSLSSFRKGLARGTGARPPPIARLEFLRSRIEELEEAVAAIARRPRRRLTAEDVDVPYHRARGVLGPEILRSLRGRRLLRERGTQGRLPPALNGYLPERIRLQRRIGSLDLPEHRQMGACLRAWSDWMSGVAGLLQRGVRDADSEMRQASTAWSGRCRGLSRRLAAMAREAPFAQAGEARASLGLSSVFRNDPAYRRFYQLWRDMNLGVAAVFGDFLNLPVARTFELYELWCFLRLVRAGAEAFGDDAIDTQDLFVADARGGVTLAAGALTVQVADGWKICFQKQYREFWLETDGRGSYSRTMTPDVIVARERTGDPSDTCLIVLDAKYRIDEGLNDALSSIHTYRDALVREAESGEIEGIVSAAYLLTPYVPHLQDEYRRTGMPGRLFHPDYRSSFRFGATTLRPGMSTAEVADLLRRVAADAAGGA